MNSTSRPVEWAVWGFLAAVILAITGAFLWTKSGRQTPLLPVYGEVGGFTLTNQMGRATTLADLRGQVWIADIIFSRCPGPCARMTRQMEELQTALPAKLPVRFVSLTTDPDYDSPLILNAYGKRFGADPGRWSFLTGTKREIARLATDGLKLTAVEKKAEERDNPEDLFIHSTVFVLVDRQGRLRGVFETGGEGVDWGAIKGSLIQAAKTLAAER